MIIAIIIILILISVGMAFVSLRNMQKMHEVTKAKEDLSRSKILYQRDAKIEHRMGKSGDNDTI